MTSTVTKNDGPTVKIPKRFDKPFPPQGQGG